MKKWKETPNVKILVADFLLAIIEFFSLALTAAALLSEIC